MFKKNFIRLCALRDESPSFVCKKIGISPAAFSQWTDNTVPRKVTQLRASEYFGVTVEELMSDIYFQDKKPAAESDELANDIKLITDLVAQLDEKQLPLVLSMAQDIPKLSYDQLRSIAEVIRNMVK